jgi:hypothetical protein
MEDKNSSMQALPLQPDWPNRTIEGIAEYIQQGKAKNIICMVGAGISVSAGIPDFRTPGTGLYDNLQRFNLLKPEDVFDLYYFSKDPKPFHMLAKVASCPLPLCCQQYTWHHKVKPAHGFHQCSGGHGDGRCDDDLSKLIVGDGEIYNLEQYQRCRFCSV